MNRIICLCVLLIFCLTSCRTHYIKHLESGDMIFVESNEQNLSSAISRVTKVDEHNISFDHIGIVEKAAGSVNVLHATTQGGSIKQSLNDFIQAHKARRLVVYRLKDEYKSAIPSALLRANQMLGKPYNYLYIPSDTAYYCSDFIERAFRESNIFKLEPMTFVNPATKEVDAYWKSFYDKHNVEVPEGLPGCNPNGLSHSDKIEKLFMIE